MLLFGRPIRCTIVMTMQFNLIPPTETTTISARSGACARPSLRRRGLRLRRSARPNWPRAGAEIKVLYLTDSSGGREITENREAYAARRRAEAQRGLDLLGITQLEVLAIPDGTLAASTEAAAEAIERVDRASTGRIFFSRSHPARSPPITGRRSPRSTARSPTVRGGTDLDGIMNVLPDPALRGQSPRIPGSPRRRQPPDSRS